jgi:hypothetical protein
MTDEKKIEIALQILADVPRYKVLEALGLRDVQAEMVRIDAVGGAGESKGKISFEKWIGSASYNEYDKYYGF